MKMVYTNERLFLVSNIKNILEAHGLEVMIKNEFAQGAIGEVSAFDSWPQLWVVDDNDEKQALAVINRHTSATDEPDWVCSKCGESNDASFEICWQCQSF